MTRERCPSTPHAPQPPRAPAPRARRRRPAGGRSSAFTLVEMLAAVVVLATLGTISASLMMRTASVNADTMIAQQIHSDLVSTLERVERLLREIPAQSGSTNPNITSLSATSLVLGNGTALTLSGTNLQLTEPGQSAVTLLGNVSALSITAFSDVNAALGASLSGSQCNSIRRVALSMTVTRQGVSDTLRTKVFLRCALAGAANGT